ncbi:hypothetical protein PoB_000796700 [Plakobranchus ocellatus]|uniref:Uncharacterized protein n=1 Tax=Plakobranchus ocellatus TaxID=259542 RepID=A0AAV3YGB4_9GAST|nr:hypothetical protein PoB_000796700 [Plakobranchus ocellatus]
MSKVAGFFGPKPHNTSHHKRLSPNQTLIQGQRSQFSLVQNPTIQAITHDFPPTKPSSRVKGRRFLWSRTPQYKPSHTSFSSTKPSSNQQSTSLSADPGWRRLHSGLRICPEICRDPSITGRSPATSALA